MLDGGTDMTASNIKNHAGLSGEALDTILLMLDSGKIPGEAVALALDGALRSHKRMKDGTETSDLSWTGPVQLSVEGRSSVSVLEEMIRGAHRTVIVVGYSITDDAGKIVSLLRDAAGRGADVTFVVHSDGDGANLRTLKRLWGHGSGARVFTRTADTSGTYFKIHAKMVVTDAFDMLVTSANLTWHGMNRNFELGLRVRGRTAGRGHSLIHGMIKSGYLAEVRW